MSLGDASRALEIVDARLVAIQSRMAANVFNREGIVDLLDLVIGDVRAAAEIVTTHSCDLATERVRE